MRTFTAVIPAKSMLPPDLALLLAPIRANDPSNPDEYVGHSEGVLLDEQERVVAFLVRISPHLVPTRPRTLMAAAAVTVTDDWVLHLQWTEAQLLAQPRLDENLQPHDRLTGGPPVESQWMPARPNVIPAEDGTNKKEAIKEGVEGGAVGAVLGAIAGFAVGGPIGAASLAAFFAAGGGLAGVLSGATQESAADAGEMKFDSVEPEDGSKRSPALVALEERLRDPALQTEGFVQMIRFSPMTTTHAPSEQEQVAASARGTAQRRSVPGPTSASRH